MASKAAKRATNYFWVLALIGISLIIVVIGGRETKGQEAPPPPAAPPADVPAGDRDHTLDCRMAHLMLHEMPAYHLKWLSFSAWDLGGTSGQVINGVRYLWVRKSDGLEVDMDVAFFHRPGEAHRAASIRLDELGLAPEPRTRETVGKGVDKFGTAALDNKPLGEQAWARRDGTRAVQQVFVQKKAAVSVVAHQRDTADVAEVMKLTRIVASRIRELQIKGPQKPNAPQPAKSGSTGKSAKKSTGAHH